MMKGLVAMVSLFLASGVSAQTASDLAAKYTHHEVYEVQPGVQMTAKFSANGSVCEMKVEQERFLKDEIDMTFGIDRDQIDRLIDQLVPASERGEKDKKLSGMTIGAGQVAETVWRYANVDVHVLSTISGCAETSAFTIGWRHRKC
jgi:hypothetical protein